MTLALALATALGLFWCPEVRCAVAPQGLAGYYQDQRLLITALGVPWAVLACEPPRVEGAPWGCA